MRKPPQNGGFLYLATRYYAAQLIFEHHRLSPRGCFHSPSSGNGQHPYPLVETPRLSSSFARQEINPAPHVRNRTFMSIYPPLERLIRTSAHCLSIIFCLAPATPLLAAPGELIALSDDINLDPIADIRLRYETADQPTFPENANALTLRARGGVQLEMNRFAILAEAEGTVALVDDFNDTLPGNGREPFPVIADPESLALNRLFVGYRKDGFSIKIGRQRIIHDNARFLGNVGWRQNEQTFDAVRGQAEFGPVEIDAAYAISQRTIFGSNSPNNGFAGDFIFLRGMLNPKPVKIAGYSYLIDYENRVGFSSQTYGLTASVSLPVGPFQIDGKASYAVQSDLARNPIAYDADYLLAELGGAISGFGVKVGYEQLGSDDGVAAFQTPLATAHAFNGFADIFLVTPAAGLRDRYISASKNFEIPAVPGLRAVITYHDMDSEYGGLDYGTEIDAVLAFRIGDIDILAKYANYQSTGFGVDTERFWIQSTISY